MNRNLLIKLAEESGLLVKDEGRPYSMPAHQRFISRLMNLANKIERNTEEEVASRFEDEDIKFIVLGGKQ